MTIALVTSIYGGHDELHELPAGIRCDDAVCVTDDDELRSDTWRVVVDPKPDEHPNRAAKLPKLLPWLFTDCSSSVWIDAAYRVLDADFPWLAVSRALPWAAHKHPGRDCIYDEADVSMRMPKYELEPIREQIEHYRSEQMPRHWGLWENGCTARLHTLEVCMIAEAWQAEIERFSFQDQISAPYVWWKHDMRPQHVPRHEPWLVHEPSTNHYRSYNEPHFLQLSRRRA